MEETAISSSFCSGGLGVPALPLSWVNPHCLPIPSGGSTGHLLPTWGPPEAGFRPSPRIPPDPMRKWCRCNANPEVVF